MMLCFGYWIESNSNVNPCHTKPAWLIIIRTNLMYLIIYNWGILGNRVDKLFWTSTNGRIHPFQHVSQTWQGKRTIFCQNFSSMNQCLWEDWPNCKNWSPVIKFFSILKFCWIIFVLWFKVLVLIIYPRPPFPSSYIERDTARTTKSLS